MAIMNDFWRLSTICLIAVLVVSEGFKLPAKIPLLTTKSVINTCSMQRRLQNQLFFEDGKRSCDSKIRSWSLSLTSKSISEVANVTDVVVAREQPLFKSTPFTLSLLSAMIGVTTGYLVYYTKLFIFGINRTILVKYPVLLPLLGGLGMSALIRLNPNTKKSPILPLTEHSQSTPKHQEMWPQLLSRYVGAYLSIGGGAALGTAGVCAELAMMCTYKLFMTINNLMLMDFTPAQQRLLLLSAAAAGAGANFNAPITGVLYATEFTSKLFAPGAGAVEPKDQVQHSNLQVLLLSVASTLGVLVIRSGYFASPIKSSIDWGKGFGNSYSTLSTLAVYSALGFIAGHLFKIYASFRSQVAKMYEKMGDYLPPIVAGALTAASVTPQSIPAGFVTVNQIISNSISLAEAIKFFLLKFFLVSSAAVSGFIGGQIAPLVFVGSGFGGVLSQLIKHYAPQLLAGHNINTLGVVCGAALVGCNFNSVLFPTILIAEMSRSVEPTLAVLLATTIAKIVVG